MPRRVCELLYANQVSICLKIRLPDLVTPKIANHDLTWLRYITGMIHSRGPCLARFVAAAKSSAVRSLPVILSPMSMSCLFTNPHAWCGSNSTPPIRGLSFPTSPCQSTRLCETCTGQTAVSAAKMKPEGFLS